MERRVARCLCLLLLVAVSMRGQVGWRFWTVADGMAESYTQSLASGADGSVWVRHGSVRAMSVLDGYSVRQIPEPRNAAEVNWLLIARVYSDLPVQAWTVEDRVLKQWTGGEWIAHPLPPGTKPAMGAMPVGNGRVWVLFQDRLAEYLPAARSWRVLRHSADAHIGAFASMIRGSGGDLLWIAGDHGALRLDAASAWTELNTEPFGLHRIRRLLTTQAGVLFFTGMSPAPDTAVVAAKWDGSRMQVLARSPQLVHAWQTSAEEQWLLERAMLLRTSGVAARVDRRGPLAGSTFDIGLQPAGAFWLATSEGLARYAPPLWSTPAPLNHLEEAVYSITEDQRGKLWFAGTQHLIENDAGSWRLHPLPKEYRLHTGPTDYLTSLPDGRISVKVFRGVSGHQLVLFDPARRTFEEVRHPEGLTILLAWRRRDGTLWTVSGKPCQLEIFDGSTFRNPIKLEPESWCNDLRDVVETSDGAVWVGSTSGGRFYRGGKAQDFGPAQGYPEQAVFKVMEWAPSRVLVAGRDALSEFDGRGWKVWRTGLDRTRSIIPDGQGGLWLAAASGIHRYRDGAWISNTEDDGLRSDIAYRVFADSRGRVWAGTSRGVSLYHPEADTEAPRTEIKVGDNPSQGAADGNVQITFRGMDRWKYTPSNRLLYSYRLDGGAWSPFAADSAASLRALAAGRHVIEARAVDRNGNIGPASAPFALTIVRPWYRQPEFLVILFLSFVAILSLLYLAARQYRALERAKIAAEAASLSKSAFLANMSHEIRTPMNAIMGMTALAADRATDPVQLDYLTTVRESSDSLLGLLNDILDLSKVEAGKVDLEPVDFVLSECLQGVMATLRLRAEEKNLRLICRIDDGVPPYLNGDERRLRQILLNLVGNAIKFTEAGQVQVRARMTVATPEPDRVRLAFAVLDTGVGVPEGQQRLIFAPFEQGDGSISRAYGGTGLGLAISSRLVQLMQGSLWVESPWTDEAGQRVAGSAFHFTAEFNVGQQPRRTAPVVRPRLERTLSVLVAEDNLVNQKLTSHLLQKLGHAVEVAASGRDAVRLYQEQPFDAILMDVQMPQMDGLEATRAIRAMEARGARHVPIIGLTAHAFQGDRDKCMEAGMDAYLTKPVSLEELGRALERAAGG
ncbi:MAG: response regulator [Bryobacterales bacterium]|nr:response regulator [Bryobacterales bacterium]